MLLRLLGIKYTPLVYEKENWMAEKELFYSIYQAFDLLIIKILCFLTPTVERFSKTIYWDGFI